jgi:hypothetical protein
MTINYNEILEQWVKETSKRDFGDTYAAGYLYSTLAHTLEVLERHDPARAAMIINRFTPLTSGS